MDGVVNKSEPILRYTQYSSEAALKFTPQQPQLRIICWQEILTLMVETAVSSLSSNCYQSPHIKYTLTVYLCSCLINVITLKLILCKVY